MATVRYLRRGVILGSVIALLVAVGPIRLRAQETDDLEALNRQVVQLYQAGRYSEATEIAERSLAIAERRFGSEHTQVATALHNSALVYEAQGRYSEAEPLLKRNLVIDEKLLGPDHPEVAASLDSLASLYSIQGRHAEAEPLYKRALSIRERALGPEHPDVGRSLAGLAELYQARGQYAEAEPLLKRSVMILEKAPGVEASDIGVAVNNLAGLYGLQHRDVEAQPLYKRALTIFEKALGPDNPLVATTLDNLGGLYLTEGSYADAEPLFKRALAIFQKALGPEHPDVGISLQNLGRLYERQGRYAEAEPVLRRSLVIFETALGSDHIQVAATLYYLATLYRYQGDYSKAETLYQRSLAIRQKKLGEAHHDVGQSLTGLASLYLAQGRHAEAGTISKRTLAIAVAAMGSDHPDVAASLHNLAVLALAQRDWAHAAAYWRRATKVIERRSERGLTGSEGRSGEAVRHSEYFSGLIKMTDRLAPQGHADRARRAREMFETAQWAQASDAASSLTQMATRSAKGDTALAKLVRERQDLVGEWQAKDRQLIAAKSELPAKRNPNAEKVLSDRITAIDGRLREIDTQFAKDFPEYASLTSPKPASVAEVQTLLGTNEALVLFLDTLEFKPTTPEETFIWVITKSDVRWEKSELGTKALTESVATLRCGLDVVLWDDEAAATRCRNFGKTAPEHDAYGNVRYETLPFDMTRANALYEALFGPVADVIRDKHLLIVPSGALTQLPFQVLITDKPEPTLSVTEALRRADWLARSHALTVLPSVSSLKALRQLAKESHADRTLIGFGNPLLNGPDAQYATLAAAARSKTSCPELPNQVAEFRGKRRGMLPLNLRSGLADAGEIRSQVPLLETADELCAVAHGLRVSGMDIWLAIGQQRQKSSA